jgi:hypothetical protein
MSKRRYAVVWSEGPGPTYAGSLALDDGALVLEGVARAGPRARRSLPYSRIRSVRIGRAPRERVHRRPAVIVEDEGRHELRLLSVEGPGVTGELEERIGTAVHDAR